MLAEAITNNQRQLIEKLDLNRIGIKIVVDEMPDYWQPEVIVDVEHDENGNMVCVGCLWPTVPIVYCFTDISLLSRLDWSTANIVGHNVRTDCELLRQWGLRVTNEQIIYDTQLMAHVLDSSLPEYGLKYLAKTLLSIEYPSYDDIVGKRTKKQSQERVTLDKQPLELVSKYNAFDVYATWKLMEHQKGRSYGSAVSTLFHDLESPVSGILQDMESRGIRIDLNYLQTLRKDLEAQLKPLEEEIKNELGSINLESPKQLLAALTHKGITPVWKGKKSTDRRALENVKGYPIVSRLLGYREIETLLSSFVLPYLERNAEYVHPYFNQCGTRTGRLSCSNPNLLQIPKRTANGKLVRQMFIARQGMLLGDCDFGQIEPRVLAHLSKDPVLCGMFNDGIDFHQFTANALGISRDRAKVLNLSVGYRATWKSVIQQLKCGKEEAQNEINKWWRLFPTLRRYQDELIWKARRTGHCTTLLGRQIRVDGLESNNLWQREAAERQLINNVTQGSAAEIMKLAMINVYKNTSKLSKAFGILVQVYDYYVKVTICITTYLLFVLLWKGV